jgi:hypothetical protein
MYEIFPNASCFSTYPLNPNLGPHVDGVVGFVDKTTKILVTNQMKEMSSHLPMSIQAHASTFPPLQASNVHVVQLRNSKGNKQPIRKKKKNANKNGGMGNNNENTPDNNVGGKRRRKRKLSFPVSYAKMII